MADVTVRAEDVKYILDIYIENGMVMQEDAEIVDRLWEAVDEKIPEPRNSVENHHLLWLYVNDLVAMLTSVTARPGPYVPEAEVSEKIAGLRAILQDAVEKLDATEGKML